MPEVELRFRNRMDRDATATVQTPVVIRFQDQQGRRKRVVVGDDSRVTAIVLNGEPVPEAAKRRPPGLVIEADDDGAAATDAGTTEVATPAASDDGPGVCYEIGEDMFCW